MALRVEEFTQFHSAMNRAKELARTFNEAMTLTRSGNGWAVHLPSAMAGAARAAEEALCADSEIDIGDYSSEAEDEYHREVIEPILDEMRDDQDSFARSEEEEWFYED